MKDGKDVWDNVKTIYNQIRKMFTLVNEKTKSEDDEVSKQWKKLENSLSRFRNLIWKGKMKGALVIWNNEIKSQVNVLGGDINQLFQLITDEFGKVMKMNGKDWLNNMELLLKHFGNWIENSAEDIWKTMKYDIVVFSNEINNLIKDSKGKGKGKGGKWCF